MSETILESKGIIMTRFAGPANGGVDRRRWQIIDAVTGDSVVLDRDRAVEVARAMHADAL